MSQYTTGEIAKLCNVTIRTVQFYDTKDLLKPTTLTDGGRRLYSDDNLKKLSLICMLKSLGLSLSSIKGILDSVTPNKVLLLLLEEQEKQIDGEIQDMQSQLKAIKVIKASVRNTDKIPVNSLSDIEHIMNSKRKLRKIHVIMLIIGLLMDVVEIGTVILWIAKGIWLPFVVGLPFVILMGILMVRIYYKNTAYICAECNTKFKPSLGEFIFSNHTPKTRKLKCPECGYSGYCVETTSEELKE